MNTNLIEQLLNESESAYLDFKKEQYLFDVTDDDAKSELLKDILAFTNAWRRTDAYILIGVREIKGSRSKVEGITKHLEDHSLQQFVNNKTQQPITLSYIPMTFDGQQIGVIKIPVQSRPVYLKKDYGKLKKNIVYIRRGSSTDEASPDEIAKMGAADIKGFSNIDITSEFADLRSRTLQGDSIILKPRVLNLDPDKIPDFTGEISGIFPNINFGGSTPNKRYYRELVKYFDEKFLLKPVGFAVKNLGQVTVHTVRMIFSVEQTSNVKLLTEDKFSDHPAKYFNFLMPQTSTNLPMVNKSNVSLETYDNTQVITIEYGNIQPKAIAWPDETIFIGSRKNQTLEISAQIFADELSEPAAFNLQIGFETEGSTLRLTDLEKMLDEEFNHLLDELDD
jgi:hypothetical protein